MLAFNNDPELKIFLLKDLAAHREADEIVHGTYWTDGKGCAIGCSLEAVRKYRGDAKIDHRGHYLYETHLGIPEIIARLEDRIFEGISNGTAKDWPARFASAITPGANLSMIWPQFALWLLDVELRNSASKNDACAKSVADVATLFREWVDTKVKPPAAAWRAAAAAAADAAADAYAAAAAAWCAAAAVAAAAADAAAADAAADAAWCAAVVARTKFYERMADKLVELLAAA